MVMDVHLWETATAFPALTYLPSQAGIFLSIYANCYGSQNHQNIIT